MSERLKRATECNCVNCNKRFTAQRYSLGKFCSMDCKYEHQKSEKINGKSSAYRCAVCHAALGFGLHKSAQFLHMQKTPIAQRLKAGGVTRYQPEGGSWQVSAAIFRRKEKAWQDAWMSEYDFKFPEWRRSDFASIVSRYQLMSKEERLEHNRKTEEKIRSCPIRTQRKRDQINDWKIRNADKVKQYQKSPNTKVLQRKYRKYPINKIKHNLRRRMRDLLNKAKEKKMSVSGLIGCTSFQFKEHLEKQFKRGMTWRNYGKYWHVDHILPCAAFDHTDKKQVAQCWHYTNLRPLRAAENMLKSDTITEPQMSLLL